MRLRTSSHAFQARHYCVLVMQGCVNFDVGKLDVGCAQLQAHRCRGVPFHRERGIHALGGRSRSFHDARSGSSGPADETCREYERVVDPKYLDEIRAQAKKFSNKRLSRRSGVARSAIINFKKGRNTIKPCTLRKLTRAIHDLQNGI